MKIFAEIRKVDEEQRMVWGYASTEAVDSDGEIVSKAAIKDAWDDYMKFANVREMHQPLAAGVVKEYQFDDVGVEIGAKVVDDAAWNKVKEGVYKGFSIGGRKKPGGYDKLNKTITAMELIEISLVDRPANPEALISMYKMDSGAAPVEPAAEDPAQGMTAEQFETFMKSAGFADVLKRVLAANPELIAKAAEPVEPAPAVEPSVVEPAVKEPSALRKSLQLLKGDADAIQKGLYSVASLADLLQALAWLQESVAYERDYEGDNSTVPEQLAAGMKMIGDALLAMASEEVSELMEGLMGEEPVVTPIELMCKAMTTGATSDIFSKVSDACFYKAGARNSASDLERIQKMHDLANELGADCATTKAAAHSPTEPVAKASGVQEQDDVIVKKFGQVEGDVSKMSGLVEKLSGGLAKTNKQVETMASQIKDIVDILKTSAQPKGVLRVVSKGDDLGGETTQPVVTPVLKSDGSVDDVATQIKAIHAGGGKPIVR